MFQKTNDAESDIGQGEQGRSIAVLWRQFGKSRMALVRAQFLRDTRVARSEGHIKNAVRMTGAQY